jgi:hypothetical protein
MSCGKATLPTLVWMLLFSKKCDTVFNRSAWSGDLPIEDPSTESPPVINGRLHSSRSYVTAGSSKSSQ